jgi:hypothetical protein
MRSTAIQSSRVNTASDADSRKLADFCGVADRNRQSTRFYRETSRWRAPLAIAVLMLLGKQTGEKWKTHPMAIALRRF